MTTIKVQLKNDSGVAVLSGFNGFNAEDIGTGLLSADLLDDSGSSTGVSLSEGSGGFTAQIASGLVDGTPDPEFPKRWFEFNWYASNGERFVLAGLPASTAYTLEVGGHNGNGRSTTFSATNGGASATYAAIADPDPDPYIPNSPVVINGTTSDSGTLSISSTGSSLNHMNGFALTYTEAATGPTITDIDGDESVYPGQSFVITGTNFGATQGTGSVDIDGVAQTVTAWGDTSITCTALRGGNEYGTGKTLTVTTDAATTATFTVAQEAQPDTFAVTAASPNTIDDASLWSGLVDTATSNPVTVVDGDQAWVKNPSSLGNLSITPAGAISADTTGDFVVQFWKASEGVWGSDQTVSFTLPAEATDNWPFGKAINPIATKNWTWGSRHPITGMRVRIFK